MKETILEGNIFRENIKGFLEDCKTSGPISRGRNSNEVVGYNRAEMPNRGIDWVRCFVYISNITALLTALTACKVGKYDLIRKWQTYNGL